MPLNRNKFRISVVGGMALLFVIEAIAFVTTKSFEEEDEPFSTARKVSRLLDRMPVIDGHNDFPWNVRKLAFNDLGKFNFSSDLIVDPVWGGYWESFTDLPRLKKGKVGGQFWVAYTPCTSNYKDSVAQTLEQIDVIKRLVDAYPNDLKFASSAAEIEGAIGEGKIASLIGIEGGHSIQSSFAILRLVYEMGARYMTLTHNCNLPWADASLVDDGTLLPVNNGLSEFGLKIIDEMNRLGMIVDLSHVSEATMKDALKRSKAPVIFSHSAAKAICNHHRNVPDDVLRMVKEKRGIVMVTFFREFINCNASLDATADDVIEHIEHIRTVCGVGCIGIGADYDGIDFPAIDLPDVSSYPLLFEKLFEKGWLEEDLEKLSGRNLLRVFKEVEMARDQLRGMKPNQDVIHRADVVRVSIETACVTAPFIDDPAVPEKSKKLSTNAFTIPDASATDSASVQKVELSIQNESCKKV